MQHRESEFNRRRHPREEVSLAGSAFGLGRSRSVVVSDLSPQGAQLDARDLPARGEDLFMVVGSFDTLAKVVWRNADKCGIGFDDAVADDILAKMKQEAKWTSVAGWYR